MAAAACVGVYLLPEETPRQLEYAVVKLERYAKLESPPRGRVDGAERLTKPEEDHAVAKERRAVAKASCSPSTPRHGYSWERIAG